MSTWVGAIIDGARPEELEAAAQRHGIELTAGARSPLLVQVEAVLGGLVPPKFAQAVSEELQCTVIAFVVQTTASVEEVEHWESGRLVRKLLCEEGEWTAQGEPQPWEATYFFSEEGEADLACEDELSAEDRARYERARKARDAASIMDLLWGGSVWPMVRLCEHFGVDPRHPGAVHRPPRKRRLPVALIAVILVVGACLLGALTKP